GEDQRLLAAWTAVQRADPGYAALLEQFRAASIARARTGAPAVKRQRELIVALGALDKRCPGPQRAGCEQSGRERQAIARERAARSQTPAQGAHEIPALNTRMQAAERALPGYEAFATRRTALRAEIDASEGELRAARERVAAAFPHYAALVEPRPLTLAETQRLLGPDEALIAMLTGSEASFVWVITRERGSWAEIDAGSTALAKRVRALRRGLDPLAQQDAEGAAGARPGIL